MRYLLKTKETCSLIGILIIWNWLSIQIQILVDVWTQESLLQVIYIYVLLNEVYRGEVSNK